ncbi:MAG: hypothetical protein WCD70_06960 [Alphaproteobacteria bacterium]
MRRRIRCIPRSYEKSVGLDGNTKIKIHYFIEQIRTTIDKAELPEDKREALLKKLNRFALEVDLNRTPLDAALGMWLSIADGIGQGFEKLEPARKWVDSIASLMGRAKSAEDASSTMLPKFEVLKQIEAPPKFGSALESFSSE